MASYDTCAAGFCTGEGDGVTPHFAVGHFQSDMPGLTGGMHLVTGFTTPSPLRLIDMQVMKVLIAISEICQCCGDFVVSDVLLMTLKTQGVFVRAVGIVELRREEQTEDLGVR